jgi:superfamily II DNA or RNA helicase
MQIDVFNEKIIIKDCDSNLEKIIKESCSYMNKSVIFEIKRLQKSYYMRPQFDGNIKQITVKNKITELKKTIYGSLFVKRGNSIILPSGMLSLVEKYPFTDHREINGNKISLPYKKKLLVPRDYQEEAIDAICNNYRGIIEMAMGLGKSLVAIHAVKRLKKKALIVVPTENIAKQFYKEMVHYFGENKIGIFYGKKKKIKDVTIGIANSVSKNIDEFKNIGLGVVIIDEAHKIASKTFFEITKNLSFVGRMFGLTATNFRSDGLDILIGAYCGSPVIVKDIKWGIKNGWLADPHFIIRNIDSGNKQDPRDKLNAYKAHVLYSQTVKERIKQDVKGLIKNGLKVLVIVNQISHGEELSNDLECPFGQGSDKETFNYIQQMKDGKLDALVGTAGIFSEGVNVNCIDVLVLATFAKSEGMVTQSVGRAMRKTETKDKCIILDYCITNSTILSRYLKDRVSYYKKITSNIKYLT